MSALEPPCVSVVIPTYNHAHYLHRAIKSVLEQTFSDFEIIVVDNHSKDNTDEVVHSFQDSRITLLKISNNGVIAASRNAGISAAKGTWIAFLDSDDWWSPSKLEVCLTNSNQDFDLIYHRLELFYGDHKVFRRKNVNSWALVAPVLVSLLQQGNAIANSSVVVRKTLLEQVGLICEDREMIASEDYNCWLRIAKITDKFLYIPTTLGFYLQHNLSASNRNMAAPTRRAVTEFTQELNDGQRLKLESFLRYLSGRFNYLAGNDLSAEEDLRFCIKIGELSVRVKSALMLVHLRFRNLKFGG